jgi:hypothetical protein
VTTLFLAIHSGQQQTVELVCEAASIEKPAFGEEFDGNQSNALQLVTLYERFDLAEFFLGKRVIRVTFDWAGRRRRAWPAGGNRGLDRQLDGFGGGSNKRNWKYSEL